MIIGDLIRRNAERYPNKKAVQYADRSYTFSEFDRRVNQLIRALLRRNVGKGQRIAVLSYNTSELLEVFGAAEKGGFVVVPLNWRLTPGELLTLLRDAEPSVLFVQHSLVSRISEIRGDLQGVRHFFCFGGQEPEWEDYEPALGAEPGEEAPIRASEDDVVYFIYTSGTTGTPRAAMHTHRSQVAMVECVAKGIDVRSTDVNLNVLPLFHIGGHIKRLTHSFAGCLNIVRELFDPREAAETIERERVTFIHLVPTMVASLLELPDLGKYDLSSLRTIFYAASPMPVELLKRAIRTLGPVFIQSYGQSETGPSVSMLYASDHAITGDPRIDQRLASAGRLLPGVEVKVEDDDGRTVPAGQIGEICVRSPYLMQGYWRKPEATAQTIRGGYLHTGDMGYLDEDGYLYIVDRKKDMIISGGENIYPREIEEVLYRHPAVLEAAVIGVPDDKWVEAVKAIVVLRTGMAATEEEIVDFCKANLASYKKPKSVEFRSQLPKSPAGKVLRRELREPYWEEAGRTV